MNKGKFDCFIADRIPNLLLHPTLISHLERVRLEIAWDSEVPIHFADWLVVSRKFSSAFLGFSNILDQISPAF